MTEVKNLKELFTEMYNTSPVTVKSPGRINIIGEHTDYNDGFVMPAAIDKAAYVAIAKSDSDQCELYAEDLDETYQFSIHDDLKPVEQTWANYFLGVLHQFKLRGYSLSGFNMIFTSDVPLGAGLSSSAALESSFGFALTQLYHIELSRIELAKIGQMAEHTFAGVKCGIMDQYASCLGKKDHAVLIDCRSFEHEYIPCDLGDYQFVLFDSNVKHELASSQYNVRRQQCEEGAALLHNNFPEVKSLRDASLEQLNSLKSQLDNDVYRRCLYVIEERERVMDAIVALKSGDIVTLGRLMSETHVGLSKLYEVSCIELDVLFDIASENPNIIGVRMMGGGFGGCTINVVRKDKVQETIDYVSERYEKQTQIKLKPYTVSISDGASKL